MAQSNSSLPKTRTHFGFRTALMKGFDSHQMLTSVDSVHAPDF